MALPTRTAPAPGRTTTPHGSWLTLAVLLLGQFMCIIDVLVTNVAMPSIAASLHASGASLQLVVGGYTIAYAMLLITGARLGDRYGRRRTYLAGVLIFTAASLACALAPDSQALIAFRLVQGAGAAVLVPQVFSIIQLNFTGPARVRALSAYAAVLSAGAVTGLVLGGVVVTADLFGTGWRPVFAINVPIGIVLAAAVPRLVPPDETSTGAPAGDRAAGAPAGAPAGQLDLAGLGAAACAVLLIVLPLVLGPEEGWPAWGFGCIAAGAVLAVGFVLIERRVAARGGDPLLNLAVLRVPALPSGLVTLAATQIGYGGLLFAYTLHLQTGLGESALRAGLSYLPFAAAFGLAGYNWRRLPAAARRVLVPAGLTVTILAYLALAAGLHAGITALTWTGLAAVGLGLGLMVSPLLTQSLTRGHGPGRTAPCSLTPTAALSSGVGHDHGVDVELGEPDELLHHVHYALEPYLVHAADRAGAERITVQGQDGRGLPGHAERGGYIHHRLLDAGPAGVRELLALLDRRVERGQRVRVPGRPLLGDHVARDREGRGRALVQVRQRHDAPRLLRAAGEGFGQQGRVDGAGLKRGGHLRERDAGEAGHAGLDAVLGQDRRGQQVQDVLGCVDGDGLARQIGQVGDLRVRHRVDALGGRAHHRCLGEDVQVGRAPLLRLDIGDVVAEGDVELALDLVGDHRLAAGSRREMDVQPLGLEQAAVERDEEARRIQRRNHGHVQVRLFQLRRPRPRRPPARAAGRQRQRHGRDH
jgi:MFS family permease